MILDNIVRDKRLQLKDEMLRISIEGWKERLRRSGLHHTQDLYNAVKKNGKVSIIAEVKKASPSKGIIRDDFRPVDIALEYSRSKVDAISVLTEKNYFSGDENNLVKIRQAVPLPLLRKDFILDVWQVYQSRYIGADAILLIASLLTKDELKKFQAVAGILGMQCLVEVHCEMEIETALESGARIIGINNRDLKTFKTDLETTGRLMKYIPHDRAVISESGISCPEDFEYVKSFGVDGVLMGEIFMKSSDIENEVNKYK